MERQRIALPRRGSPALKVEPAATEPTDPMHVLKQLQTMIEQMQTKIAQQEKTIQSLNTQLKACQENANRAVPSSPTQVRVVSSPQLSPRPQVRARAYSQSNTQMQQRHMNLVEEPAGVEFKLKVPEGPHDYLWGSVPEGVQSCEWEDSLVNVLPLMPQFKEVEEFLERRDFVEVNRYIEEKQRVIKRGHLGNFLFTPAGSQIPVNTHIKREFILSLKERTTVSFRFINLLSNKYQLKFDPCEGTLEPDNAAVRVEVTLMVYCTTACALSIPIVFWRGLMGSYDFALAKKSKDQIFCCRLRSQVQSKLSLCIDPDELVLYKGIVGKGSFSKVYRGKYRGQTVACKVLEDQDARDATNEFEKEMEILYTLHHPCIVNTVGAVNIPGILCIVTEWCRFGSLRSSLKTNGPNVWNPEMKVKALYDSACAMDFLHQSSIIHRDLKPDNLLVVSLDFAPVVCKLSDFGTTRWTSGQIRSLQMTVLTGTPVFMAPEVLFGRSDYTIKADVYSFALTIASTIDNGEDPFKEYDKMPGGSRRLQDDVIKGKRPAVKNGASVPPELVKLMHSCWDAVPERRPTFSVIAATLRNILSSFQK